MSVEKVMIKQQGNTAQHEYNAVSPRRLTPLFFLCAFPDSLQQLTAILLLDLLHTYLADNNHAGHDRSALQFHVASDRRTR